MPQKRKRWELSTFIQRAIAIFFKVYAHYWTRNQFCILGLGSHFRGALNVAVRDLTCLKGICTSNFPHCNM